MKIGLLVYSQCMASGLLAFSELLMAANKRAGKRIFELVWVGLDKGPIELTLGDPRTKVMIEVEEFLWHESLELILLPGFWSNNPAIVQKGFNRFQPLIAALKKIGAEQKIWSYCTSVGLMAETGRLNNQTATGTWWLADYLKQTYPEVSWRFNHTHIINQNDATACGVNGYLPFTQVLIEQHCGADTWRDITDTMVIARPEKTVQPFNRINIMMSKDKQLNRITVWVENTAASELSLNNLAKDLNASTRTISRHVKAASNLSCAQFMRLVKLRQVGEHLMYGQKTINSISDELGYSDDAALRRSFKKETGYTPIEFRQSFKR